MAKESAPSFTWTSGRHIGQLATKTSLLAIDVTHNSAYKWFMGIEPPKPRMAHSMKGKSKKPQAVKKGVLSRYVAGASKAQMARDLNISEPMVYRILDECEIRQIMEEGHSRAVQLIPKALDAVEGRLDRGDGRIGISVLNGTGVLKPGGNVTVNIANVAAQQWALLKLQKELDAKSERDSEGDSGDG